MGGFNYIFFRKVIFFFTLVLFIVLLTSCTRQNPPDPTQNETSGIEKTTIPYTFIEGFSYISELGQYQYYSMVEAGTYYICIQNISEETGTVTFSFNEK